MEPVPTDPAPAPAEGDPPAPAAQAAPAPEVEVVEPPIPDRVRRFSDALRLAAVLIVLVASVALADIAVGTAGAVDQDLADATGGLPRLLLQLLSWAAAIGVVLLPIAVGVDLVVRKRVKQLVEALAAAGLAGVLVAILASLVADGHFRTVLGPLTRGYSGGVSDPLDPVVVSLVALFTVAAVSGRKWFGPLSVVVVFATAFTSFLAGSQTAVAVFASILAGWAVGLAFRYGFGAVSTRPPGTEVAQALVDAGIPLTRLELIHDIDDDGDRHYLGTTDSLPVDVRVLDRDTFGIASGRRFLRLLRLRTGSTRPPALSLRSELEHRNLMGLTLASARVPAPRPVAVCEVGPFSAVLASVDPHGTTLQELGPGLDDAQLEQVWQLLATLHRRKVAHRGLSADAVILTPDGKAGVSRVGGGDIAADEITLRIDTAQLLTSVALAVGPQRAVASALAVIGEEQVVRAAAVLQPIAMTHGTRTALKGHKQLLPQLRDEIIALRPTEQPPPPVELRRVSARNIITVVGLGVAMFVILPQLAQVDFGTVFRTAQWGWALGAVGFSALTFAAASVALSGAVRIRLNFLHTYMTQLAVAFSGLVAPAAVGNIALNTRFLQKSGLKPAVAAASVGVAQVAQFTSYTVLLLLSGVLAGTGPRASFTPPAALVAAIPIVLLIVLGLLAVPRVRAVLSERIIPQVRSTVPQVLSVLQHPAKLAQLLGGALLLDASFVGALVCATKALGAEAPLPAIAVVYFAGAIIGSAVPTPGGLGGIEAAMSAGLIAIGVDSGVAVSSVLLYRIATYWLPIPFGWFSLNRLQKIQAI